MDEEPNERGSKRRRNVGGAVGVVVLIYLLVPGLWVALYDRGMAPQSMLPMVGTIFAPLEFAYERSEIFEMLYDFYLDPFRK